MKEDPATDEEIAEWNPSGRNIAAAIYPWRVAKLIARIERDRALIEAGRKAVETLEQFVAFGFVRPSNLPNAIIKAWKKAEEE